MIAVSQRLQSIAGKVMDNALPVQKGETVTFLAGGHNLDLAYAFAAECAKRDIEALVITDPDYVEETRLREAPISLFQRAPRLVPGLIELSDWLILMTGSRHDRGILAEPALSERLLEIQRASAWSIDQLLQLCLEAETHLVAFLDPNLQQAQALELSFEETKERFLDSLDIDYDALTALGERIIGRMHGANEIRVTSPKGTDLTLSPGQRPWINDDGQIRRVPGVTPYIRNLPVGEVFVAPLEDSAEGVLAPDNFPGSPIQNLRIEFRGSAPAEISAQEGYEFIKARLEKATGNPYCIAEFAFGTNPCGDPLLATEKAFGTVHVAIGQNTWLGGQNECSIHWDVLVDKPTVTVDGATILEQGAFTFGRV
jgi:leucyl aminopeptidase (aminopeptidase T)